MVFVIAEAGVNHDGVVADARELIDVAADAGADAVKFQTFDVAGLATPDAPKADYQRRQTDDAEGAVEMLSRLQLSRESTLELAEHAHAAGVEFMSTPFDEDAMDFLQRDVGVKRLKLSSGDLTNAPLLLHAARSGLPLIISTGMATMSEVADALDLLAHGMTRDGLPTRAGRAGARASEEGAAALQERITVLHCTSRYPAPVEDVNLRGMRSIADAFGLPVGYSDHTLGLTIPIAAAALGAVVIEKHFTLDRHREGPDHAASLEPDQLHAMVAAIREVETALGDGHKVPTSGEEETARVARRGVRTARALPSGSIVTLEDLEVRRPRNDSDPMHVYDMLGKVLAVDLPAGHGISEAVHLQPDDRGNAP